ncbi:unnamed protein product, partial [Gulo gulo]
MTKYQPILDKGGVKQYVSILLLYQSYTKTVVTGQWYCLHQHFWAGVNASSPLRRSSASLSCSSSSSLITSSSFGNSSSRMFSISSSSSSGSSS